MYAKLQSNRSISDNAIASRVKRLIVGLFEKKAKITFSAITSSIFNGFSKFIGQNVRIFNSFRLVPSISLNSPNTLKIFNFKRRFRHENGDSNTIHYP